MCRGFAPLARHVARSPASLGVSRPLKGTARANTTCPVTRVHTDPTNAARVRQEQTDAKTLTRSQNEYESITFEQCCEQVPNEAAVEAELEEHASLQHGHGHACRKPPRWPPRRPQHRPARPGGGPSVGTGPPEVRGAAGAAQVDVVYAFTDSMCLLEQLTCRSTKAEALYGERVTSPTD